MQNNQQDLGSVTREKVFVSVRDAVAEVLNWDKEALSMETNFMEDLGADSLDRVTLIVEFESIMRMEIPDQDARELKTIGQVVEYIIGLYENSPYEQVMA